MSGKTMTQWSDSTLSARDSKAVAAKFTSANAHVKQGDRQYMLAADDLRIVQSRYYRGDKERFMAAAAALFDLGPSTAYEMVQAADAYKVFKPAVQATGAPVDTIGYRTWAKLDRFTAEAKQADGLEVVKAEAKRAKVEGGKPFTNAGLAASIKTVTKPAGDVTGTDDDRKVQRVAGKYRDVLRDSFNEYGSHVTAKGERAGFLYALRLGAEWGSQSGALVGQAVTALAIEWAAEDRAAEIEAARIETLAAKKAGEMAAAASLAPAAPASKPDATVKRTSKPAAPKRSNSKPKPAGIAGLVANTKQ